MTNRRLLIAAALVTLVCSIASGATAGFIIKNGIDANNARQQRKLFAAQVQGCQRTNAAKADANSNANAEYRIDSLFAVVLNAPAKPHETAAQRKLVRDFRAAYQSALRSLTWTPLNPKCSTAPTAPPLVPIRFAQQRPPASALNNT